MKRMTVKKQSDSVADRENTGDIELNILDLAGLLLKRKRVIAYATLGAMVLFAGISLLIPNTYTSTATILPSSAPDKMSQLKNLAGLGGLLPGDDNSTELFPVILRSQAITDPVLASSYAFEHEGETRQITLPDYLEQNNPDKLRKALAAITSIATDKKTGVITIGVETTIPALSQAIVARYMQELESFNIHKRRTEARERSIYLSREIEQVEVELSAAEDSLSAFQMVNRNWATSSDPEVVKILGRLQRDVETRTQTLLYLTQEFEIAKLDARKDVPVVGLLDKPTLPTQKTGPRRTLMVLLAGMITFMMSLFVTVGVEAIRRLSKGPGGNSYDSFQQSLSSAFPRAERLVNRLQKSREEDETRTPSEPVA